MNDENINISNISSNKKMSSLNSSRSSNTITSTQKDKTRDDINSRDHSAMPPHIIEPVTTTDNNNLPCENDNSVEILASFDDSRRNSEEISATLRNETFSNEKYDKSRGGATESWKKKPVFLTPNLKDIYSNEPFLKKIKEMLNYDFSKRTRQGCERSYENVIDWDFHYAD